MTISRTTLAALAAVAGLAAVAPGAVAEAAGPPAPVNPAWAGDGVPPAISSDPPRGPNLWYLGGALRMALLRDPAFDPFSANDGLVQVGVSLTRVLAPANATGGVVPALGLAWEDGRAQAIARGADASLQLRRLALALEARWVPRHDVYVAARLAPGVLLVDARLDGAGAPVSLATSYTTLAADASVGGAYRLTRNSTTIGFWLLADAGYGWAPAHDLELRPTLPASDAAKGGATSLGRLAPRGPFMRVGLGISY